MNKGRSPIKASCYSTPLIQPFPMKTSSFISSETVNSSTELNQLNRPKNTELKKNVQEQIKKAHLLCQNIKKRTANDKTLNQNKETEPNPLQRNRQQAKVVQNGKLFKELNLKTSSPIQDQHSTPRLRISPPKNMCFSSPVNHFNKKKQSPEKSKSPKKNTLLGIKELVKKKTRLSDQPDDRIQNFRMVNEIQSFIMDEDEDPLDESVVEEHGAAILNWNVCQGKASEFKILKFIDEGRFGKVYLAQSYRNGFVYSIKTLYRSSLDPDTFQQLIREVKIQSFLNHPSIVKLYHFFVDEQSAYLVLEPCLGKNLYQNLKENGKMAEKVVKEYIRQVCTAVEYMHKNDIIHRDLKPENILLHENSIKICDFGWAVHSPMLRATQCGTPVYTSPEIVKKLPYDSKIDIWSIGILTYELLYGTIPFEIRHIDDLAKITEQEVYFSQEIVISQSAKDFMNGCLQKNPNKRYTIRQLLEHEFLYKIEKFRSTIV